MSLKVEKLEKNMAKLTIEVPAEEFEKALEGAYQKNKNKTTPKMKNSHTNIKPNTINFIKVNLKFKT